jgi:hypothetical protein
LDVNALLRDPELKLGFDKQLVADLIAAKQRGDAASESCTCPEWLRGWYAALDAAVLSQCTKRAPPATGDVDAYVRYYMECDLKYGCVV